MALRAMCKFYVLLTQMHTAFNLQQRMGRLLKPICQMHQMDAHSGKL